MKDFPFVESILRQVFNLKDDSAIFASTTLEQTNESGTPEDVAFSLFAQHERTLTGASPQTALIVGRLQQKVGPMNKNLVQGWKAGAMLPKKYKPDNYPNCRQ